MRYGDERVTRRYREARRSRRYDSEVCRPNRNARVVYRAARGREDHRTCACCNVIGGTCFEMPRGRVLSATTAAAASRTAAPEQPRQRNGWTQLRLHGALRLFFRCHRVLESSIWRLSFTLGVRTDARHSRSRLPAIILAGYPPLPAALDRRRPERCQPGLAQCCTDPPEKIGAGRT